ncbi:prolyl oligopeptidase family serine peptidase [Aliikangiella coralliicola]|uniref:S9 family peptidase n=1 Tax=Aliikangiella coralliicola TaxID=2592383 RepID=A0A545UDT6_9GAMM|nr:prolyl oligopeptidase family serine peptidase [Aliikangiella coralliicola]TQV87642.1 S9 family peptidase [Aliikangiella coralliicola]
MKNKWLLVLVFVSFQSAWASVNEDPFIWLEDIESKKSMDWVKGQNKISESELRSQPIYQEIHDKALEILNSKDKIRYVNIRGDKVYNFWRDEKNIRGLYREANLQDYLANKPQWETVFDLDKISEAEGENWVYSGMNCLYPDYELCLMSLSRGGADATVVREFNIKTRKFVENGFYLPEAKSATAWKDANTLYVGTDFGEGSLTSSGYPRISKLWKRGTPLTEAKVVYEASTESVSAGVYRSFRASGKQDFIYDATSFYTTEFYLLNGNKKTKIIKQDDAQIVGIYNKNIFVELKSDWKYQGKEFKQGTVIYSPMASVKKGRPDYRVFVEPSDTKIIDWIQFSKNYVWVSWMDNVGSVIERMEVSSDGKWKTLRVPMDTKGQVSLSGLQEDSDSFFVTYENFTQPDTLYYMEGMTLKLTELQKLPAWFDAKTIQVEQHFADSKDGTKVPYFVVMKKGTRLNGKNPTLLYGYGGFEVSMRPYYSALTGSTWLARGGVYVLANIRGGGEFGPRWHQAALKEKRSKAYEDFEAIAKDLFARKITSSKHLGAQGGSNGGLLVGNMITRSPELFNAIVCQVPLLDMKRYNKLLAGASWMAEYGDPDNPKEWDYIKAFSPYHNLDENRSYPRVFFTTSTRDDRVHPGHARKMVARMKNMGHDVLYYENIEGGHGGASDNNQEAHLYAMIYAYLFMQLK